MTSVCRSKVLISSKIVKVFLTESREAWKKNKDTFVKLKFGKGFGEVVTEYGQADVEARTDSKRFCDEAKNFNTVFSYLTG